METLGLILTIIGIILVIFYGIVLMIRAFQTHILWGLGYIIVPFVSLIFVIMHWDVAKKPFLMSLLALVILFVGNSMLPLDSKIIT